LSADERLAENSFLQIEVLVTAPCREALIEILWELETLGCEETGESTRVRLTAFFPVSEETGRLKQQILGKCKEQGWEPLHVSQKLIQFSPQEWLDRYSENFRAFAVGDSFFIYPSWGHPSPTHPVNILLDPGHAFGTGTHESTQLCLLALECSVSGVSTLLDVGTGSGILTIAAQKLNPMLSVFACDNDPLAVEAAHENFLRNQIPSRNLFVGEPATIASQFDLVVANLTAVIIQDLASEISRLARKYVIVAGFTSEQGPSVLESLKENFELLQTFSRNGWLCYKLKSWQES